MMNTLMNLQAISESQSSKFKNAFTEMKEKPKAYVPKNEYSNRTKANTIEEDIVSMLGELDDEEIKPLTSTYIIDEIFDNEVIDENISIRNALVNQGRKYARTHDDDGTTSEIDRAFNPQIIKLNDLLNSVAKDVSEVEHDINDIRMMHSGRNYQRMSELLSTKAQLHNTSLSIIKELSSIEKNKFDIKSKTAKNVTESDPGMMSGNILQNIFGIGHDALLESVGGREGSSGAMSLNASGDFASNTDTDEYGEFLYNQEFPNQALEETEGDKFLKYENRGIEMVLEEADDGTKTIYAEDAEGNIVDDYPLPSDVNGLVFEINHRTGVATDQLQRKYKYKSI